MASAADRGADRVDLCRAGAGPARSGLVGPRRSAALGEECDCRSYIDARWAPFPSRNPEELMDALTLSDLGGRGAAASAEHGARKRITWIRAILRIAPTLRALRHADGGLARFHGGGRGAEGRLDTALAGSGDPRHAAANTGLAMGFVRLSAARTTVDCGLRRPTAVAQTARYNGSCLDPGLRTDIRAPPRGDQLRQRPPALVTEWSRAGRATAIAFGAVA